MGTAFQSDAFQQDAFQIEVFFAVWPDPADVRAGVAYGPTGVEYLGTLVVGAGGEGTVFISRSGVVVSVPATHFIPPDNSRILSSLFHAAVRGVAANEDSVSVWLEPETGHVQTPSTARYVYTDMSS